jgi:hypothetical protein
LRTCQSRWGFLFCSTASIAKATELSTHLQHICCVADHNLYLSAPICTSLVPLPACCFQLTFAYPEKGSVC